MATVLADPEREFDIIRMALLYKGHPYFIDTDVSLRHSYFSEVPIQDYWGQDPKDIQNFSDPIVQKITQEFWEEVKLIKAELDKYDPINEQTYPDMGELMMANLARLARAISLWERYAIPIRIIKKRVYRIWAPLDIMGNPIINTVPLNEYISKVCYTTSAYTVEIKKLKKKANNWKQAVYITSFLLLTIFIVWLNWMINKNF